MIADASQALEGRLGSWPRDGTGTPPGVTLVNASGFEPSGFPFIKVFLTALEPNQSIQIPLVLTDPFDVP